MRTETAIVFAAMALVPARSEAAVGHGVYVSVVSTSDLARDCAATEAKPLAETFCLGYAMGSLDILVTEGVVCTDSGFTTGQGVAVARKYLRDHPEEWNLHPLTVMRNAFSRAFPCKVGP